MPQISPHLYINECEAINIKKGRLTIKMLAILRETLSFYQYLNHSLIH